MTKDVSESPLLELALESSEMIADGLLDNDVLKEIPVVGTAIKICKAADNFRNRLFIAKLQRFLAGTNSDENTRKAWIEKCKTSPDETRRIGESILLTLDRLSDLKKAELIGVLFVAYANNVIDSDDILRLTRAIDIAYIGDIEKLLAFHKCPEDTQDHWAKQLVTSGLTEVRGGDTFDSVGTFFHNVSKLGNKLRNANFHGQKLKSGG